MDNGSVHRNGFSGKNPQGIALPDLFSGDHFFCPIVDPAALCGRQADQLIQSLFCPVRGSFLQKGADGHNEGNFTGSKQIPDGDGGKHGDGDQECGRDFADAGIIDDPPDRQIQKRDAADEDCDPCGIKRQDAQLHRRAAKLLCQMGHQINQQKNTCHNGHGQPGKQVIDLL